MIDYKLTALQDACHAMETALDNLANVDTDDIRPTALAKTVKLLGTTQRSMRFTEDHLNNSTNRKIES